MICHAFARRRQDRDSVLCLPKRRKSTVNSTQSDAYSGRIIYEIFYCSVITCFLPENVAELDSRMSSVTMEQRCRSICASGLHIGLLAIQYTQACSAPDFEPGRKLPTMTRRSQLFIRRLVLCDIYAYNIVCPRDPIPCLPSCVTFVKFFYRQKRRARGPGTDV